MRQVTGVPTRGCTTSLKSCQRTFDGPLARNATSIGFPVHIIA